MQNNEITILLRHTSSDKNRGGTTFGHDAFGVVLHPNTIIEENVFIQHHASTGVRWTGDGAPVIKSGARIGAYAIILGPITIGENAIIGAGTVVTHDVPANTVYVNQRTDRYLEQNPNDPTFNKR